MTTLEQQRQERIHLASAQQRVAANPKTSVWVEASAGTGKTKVLSDRVLRLLLNGTDPARILCLTYTKAAAVEMSNRIASRLSSWAVIDDNTLIKELEKLLGNKTPDSSKLLTQARKLFAILLDTPGGIKIQTIHSFCQEILKRFPLEAKISPYFEVMDDRASTEALESIKKEILQSPSSPELKQAIAVLTSSVSELRFPDILQTLTEKRNTIESFFEKHTDLSALIDTISTKLGISKTASIEETENTFWEGLPREDLKTIITALDNGTAKTKETASFLSSAIEHHDLPSYQSVFLTKDLEPKKNPLPKASQKHSPEALFLLNKETDRLLAMLEKMRTVRLLNATTAVLTVASEMLSLYRRYKQHHSKMDYNDLIILTKKLLETPKVADWILFKLDGGIDNVLIDEAQDTSPEQWAIIKALTAEFFSGIGARSSQPTVFVVGDRKQSIYSFQGADPREFEKMHHYFETISPTFQTVNMEVSFRSTAAVLDVVNKVFAQDKAREGVVSEDQNLAHIPSRIGDGGRIELWPLLEPLEDNDSSKIWLPPVERIVAPSASSRLAAQIAQTIKAKVSSRELLKSKGRPLKYRDFLILVQRRNSFVEEMVRACKNIGVAITGVDKISLLEQIAVNDLLAAAKFALLPEDDLNLACLLKSPLFSLTDDDLFTLCYKRENASLWQRLVENKAYTQATEILLTLKALAEQKRPFEFFSYILNNIEGRKKFISRLGYDCEDALDEFINLSLDFEREHIPSLQLFVDWILKDDVEIKRDLEQNETDAVRLMTVHGSKGLQAPIVILPDTVRLKSTRKEAGLLHDNDILLYPLGKDYFEQNCEQLLEHEQTLSLEEYHRLLYVALTRAEECLCICGYKGKNKASDDSWYELFRTAFEPLATKEDDDKWVYTVEQELPPKEEKTSTVSAHQSPLPTWLFSAPKQEKPLAKPLTPSHQDETGIAALSPLKQVDTQHLYQRGLLIHKLLQFLPAAEPEKRTDFIEVFLNSSAPDFTTSSREKIKEEVLNIIENPQFSALFSKDSLAEVSLMGQVEDRIISGQIDRLVITKDKVMIVDYKTNRPAAQSLDDVPLAYLKQMQAYKKLIAKIYPDKAIETYILWTNTARMMKIE